MTNDFVGYWLFSASFNHRFLSNWKCSNAKEDQKSRWITLLSSTTTLTSIVVVMICPTTCMLTLGVICVIRPTSLVPIKPNSFHRLGLFAYYPLNPLLLFGGPDSLSCSTLLRWSSIHHSLSINREGMSPSAFWEMAPYDKSIRLLRNREEKLW